MAESNDLDWLNDVETDTANQGPPPEISDPTGLGICTVYSIGLCLTSESLSEESNGAAPLLASLWFGFIAIMQAAFPLGSYLAFK